MPLVLTSCTSRKRVAPAPELIARTLRPGALCSVGKSWERRLQAAVPVASALDLYCGRAFRQAEAAAAKARAAFFVVSGGLGLLPATVQVPSYSLTVTPGAQDSILSVILGAVRAAEWWAEVTRVSPFATRLATITRMHRGPILLSLPASYLMMIADDLLDLPARTLARLRIFTLIPASTLPTDLRPYIMPYDGRLDGADSPVPGTRSDFAQRALGHFVETVLPKYRSADFDDHAEAVEKLLANLRPQRTPKRTRLSDPEVASLIHRHWEEAQGQSSRMLRLLRDGLGVACEQRRFRALFRAAQANRTGTR